MCCVVSELPLSDVSVSSLPCLLYFSLSSFCCVSLIFSFSCCAFVSSLSVVVSWFSSQVIVWGSVVRGSGVMKTESFGWLVCGSWDFLISRLQSVCSRCGHHGCRHHSLHMDPKFSDCAGQRQWRVTFPFPYLFVGRVLSIFFWGGGRCRGRRSDKGGRH